MAKTYLDELVEYPGRVLHIIGENKTIVSLLTNIPDIDMDSDEAYSVYDENLFDYDYVDGTTEKTSAFVCVEAEMVRGATQQIIGFSLFVTVYCHKKYMKLETSDFPGMLGNRRDNLVRYINQALDGADVFGIGKLTLTSARTIASPNNYTARELTYYIPNFKYKGISP